MEWEYFFSFYPISLIFRIPPIISLNFFETEKVLVLGSIMLKFVYRLIWLGLFLFSGIEFSFEFEMTTKKQPQYYQQNTLCVISISWRLVYNYNLKYLKLYSSFIGRSIYSLTTFTVWLVIARKSIHS